MKQRLVHGLAWGTALAFGVACSTTLTEERVTRNLWIRSDTPGVDVAVRDGDKVLSQGPAPLHFQDERTRRTETFDETNWIWATAPGFALIVMGAATRTNEGGSTGDSKSGGGRY